MNTLFNAEKIVKNFGGVRALKGVNFELKGGEVHALVGENGAGKSTLIKIMSGVIQPDSGNLFLDGKKTKFANPKDAHEKGISTVYQDPLIYKNLSVIENIFLGNEIRTKSGAVDWKKQESKARELFTSLEIEPFFINQPIRNLSIGLQQITLTAKALSYSAKILIFDEPTAILTETEARRLFKIIQRLKERSVGILYISHRLEEIFEIADRVTIFRDGENVGMFDVKDINRDKIVEFMAGKVLVESIKRNKAINKSLILEVQNLSSNYYKNISFSLYPGEILGFSGLVGSGRSEVMQTLFGLIKQDKGEILLNGNKVKINNPSVAMKYGIAYLPEDRSSEGLFSKLSIKFNVSIPLIKKLKKRFWRVDEKAEEDLALKFMKLLQIKAPSVSTIVNNLSGGNQQKVLLGKWLSTKPKILILDKPTKGVDVGVKAEIHKEIAKLAEEGTAIILISSELPEIIKLSDKVIVMHEGAITGKLETKESITSKNLINAATGMRIIHSETN
ncbi:sugar ABC transporter ATP-binding protein [Patescibacteria group bacterium]|nr:sugar ABC transporter ATP-binding protein [Patescibacteria group bacterium]